MSALSLIAIRSVRNCKNFRQKRLAISPTDIFRPIRDGGARVFALSKEQGGVFASNGPPGSGLQYA